jgi:hypothetical protein
MDPALDALWKHVLDHWEDEAAHGAFLEYCQRQNQLVEAAVRYRGMKADRVRGPIAEQRLAAVAMLAFAELEVSRSARPPATHAGSLAVIALFTLATVVLMIYLWGR